MALATPEYIADQLGALEAQLRDCYGRVVYSHKIHEKAADIYLQRLHRIKLAQIVLSALTTGTLIVVLFNNSIVGTGLSAAFSAILFALNAYTKDFDLGELAQKHKDSAHRLWAVRESYLSLLTDIVGRTITVPELKRQRDDLQKSLEFIYNSAPRTNDDAYEKARQALKVNEELTFTDKEIDVFLPEKLRKG